MSPARWLPGAACALGLLSGCRPPAGGGPVAATPPTAQLRLIDVSARAGIRWRHNPCRTGKKLLPETMGGGGGFLDFDGDGWLDVLLVNGAPLPGYRGEIPSHALYRNRGDGTFEDVTGRSGLRTAEYGMGLATADWDNDGWTDVVLTGIGQPRLYRNNRGKLVDVTVQARIGPARWTTGAAWLDYDGDGYPDLFLAGYVDWTPATDLPCGSPTARQYCPPYQYRSAPSFLYRNRGDGTFEDVSDRAGIRGHSGKTLAVTPCDVNGDGWTDLHLANDTEPDILLVNDGRGRFAERGLELGISVGTDGRATGSMGVDVATPWNDGRPVVAVGNFIGQGLSLFAATGTGESLMFENRKVEAGTLEATLPMSTFGLLFSDVDLDGWLDLLALNGNLDENLAVQERKEPFRQLPQLFRNEGNGTFRDAAAAAGLTDPLLGRGLAVGDYDNDGRPDFLAVENGGRVRLWHNESTGTGSWIGVNLGSRTGPRDGSGALVTASGPGWTQTRLISTSRSYLAANDPRAHFGLGVRRVDRITVRWPGGREQILQRPVVGGYVKVE